ncbi:MAG TPA: flagellar hook-basal body complex protein [Ruminiclostridium sp.]|nr:flagellar hook-basal body complex protein [Ruminiclostridium sp.]
MVRGIYNAAAGMITQYKKIDVLGNNTANVNTVGYKESNITLSDFGAELTRRTSDNQEIGNMPLCVILDRETSNLTQGSLKNTGISTDLAVDGNGFFAVQAPGGGQVKYTRGGDFSVDAQGYLALPTGDRLLGQNGTPVYVGGNNFSVGSDGTIKLPNGTTNKINIYTSASIQNINKRKDGFFDITGAVAANGQIKQGWLEDSNTDVINNTIDMMAATRTFQGCQQAYQISSQALDKLVTQVGSIK